MKVLGVNEDLYAPRMCVICENGVFHTGAETFVIDPDREFSPDSNFQGRKYVCEQCGRLIANALGTATTEQVRVAEYERDVANQKLVAVRQKVDELASTFNKVVEQTAADTEASYAALFNPPSTDLVGVRSSNGVSTVESVKVEDKSGSARKKSSESA
jgi:hypothetical protein